MKSQKPESLSKEQVRRCFLKRQFLDGTPVGKKGKEGTVKIIERLGYVQIDTIAVINRAHHHTLWTRLPDYHESWLYALQAKERKIFEYWGHAMSYLPMRDYRFSLPRMKNFQHPKSPWAIRQLQKCEPLLQPVLDRIRSEGPLSSSDFESLPGKKGLGWWDWKPAKIALEFLFWRGDLMISERRRFQKVYDLRERVLPPGIDTTLPDSEEVGRYLVSRCLSAAGFADLGMIMKFLQPGSSRDADWQIADRKAVSHALQTMEESGEIIPVRIEDEGERRFYQLAARFGSCHDTSVLDHTLHILSPFDNLIIQRNRVQSLFGFDYALECYVPEAKRKFGYFVQPVLQGDRFIGRLDPKADRQKKQLMIKSMYFEPDFVPDEESLIRLSEKTAALARFNDCEQVLFEQVEPKRFRTKLETEVRRALESGLSN